jgi:8-oxo-dGTP pyrophosphatase MutT (NUDIX family)
MKKVAGILITSNGKCLLCKRNTEGSLPGEWSIPAGKIELGEKVVEGALREFYEETNIEIDSDLSFIGIMRRYNRDGTKPKGMFYIFTTEFDQEILPDLENAIDGDEHTECRYFTKNELPLSMEENFRNLILKQL